MCMAPTKPLKTSMDDLTIRMEGENTLASTDGPAIRVEKAKSTITGGGKMTLTGKDFWHFMLHPTHR